MRLEEAISSHLQSKLGNKLYPFLLPQSVALPAVVYLPVSMERLHSLAQDSGFVKQRIQFSTYGNSYKDAVDAARILRVELQNFSGIMGEVDIGSVLIMAEITDYEPGTGIYAVTIEFEFQFKED